VYFLDTIGTEPSSSRLTIINCVCYGLCWQRPFHQPTLAAVANTTAAIVFFLPCERAKRASLLKFVAIANNTSRNKRVRASRRERRVDFARQVCPQRAVALAHARQVAGENA